MPNLTATRECSKTKSALLMQPRKLLGDLFLHGVNAVRGDLLITQNSRFNGNQWSYHSSQGVIDWDIPEDGRLVVVGAGKAAASLAKGMEQVLGDRIDDGCIIVKYGHMEPLAHIRQFEAGHPMPDENSVEGTRELLRTLKGLGLNDRVFVLLTGGASALMVSPAPGVSLSDKAEITDLLLRSSPSIAEINAIRRCISEVKGGRLLDHIGEAQSMTLLVSDVPNREHSTVGSGPTFNAPPPDADPLSILEHLGIAEKTPKSILARLSSEKAKHSAPSSHAGSKAQSIVLGESATIVKAIDQRAAEFSMPVTHVDTDMQGNTHTAAHHFADVIREYVAGPLPTPRLFVSAGETTLEVRGSGKGGRNQEFALVAGIDLAGLEHVALLSSGTDGTDGPTDAAGAFADGETCARAAAAGLDVERTLADNDSYNLFRGLKDLHITGPTGTNVMDVVLGLVF